MNLDTARRLDEEVQNILKLIPHGYEFKVVTKTRERINELTIISPLLKRKDLVQQAMKLHTPVKGGRGG